MGGWWVADLWNSPAQGPVWVVSWIVWVIGSIVLHELAHGWAAIRFGDQTPRWAGHMTWNPLVHMGTYSLIALGVFGIAWGAMPVDPSRMRGRHAEALVLAAGPAMNLVLAIIALTALIVWVPLASGHVFSGLVIGEPLASNLGDFLFVGAFLNLILLMFNLLPVVPLDGGRIAASYIRPYREFVQTEHGMWVGFGVMILFFWFMGGVLGPAASDIVASVSEFFWSLMGLPTP
jgi:Zn-dependent protease